jgi:hypothetical protein
MLENWYLRGKKWPTRCRELLAPFHNSFYGWTLNLNLNHDDNCVTEELEGLVAFRVYIYLGGIQAEF